MNGTFKVSSINIKLNYIMKPNKYVALNLTLTLFLTRTISLILTLTYQGQTEGKSVRERLVGKD